MTDEPVLALRSLITLLFDYKIKIKDNSDGPLYTLIINQLKASLNTAEMMQLFQTLHLIRLPHFACNIHEQGMDSTTATRYLDEQIAGLAAKLDELEPTPDQDIVTNSLDRLRKTYHSNLIQHYDRAIGTGIGNKVSNGIDTGRPALIIFVTEKDHSFHKQDANQLLPKHINGIEVDVIEVGALTKQSYTTKTRPIVPGYIISHPQFSAGTLGGLFQDTDNNIVALSCNHVLADENRCKIGDLIFQPGMADQPGCNRSFSGWNNPTDLPYFATLKDFARLIPNQKNGQDSAIAVINKSLVMEKLVSPNYPNGLSLTGVVTPVVGLNVQKFGRTTGLTTGRVIALNAEFTIGYDTGPVTFTGCMVTTTMSTGGDSGSLLLDQKMNAVGLLFAGSDKVSLHTPIELIMSKYGLKVWSCA